MRRKEIVDWRIMVDSEFRKIAKSILNVCERTTGDNKSLGIFIHASVDGDCIGASTGMARVFEKLGVNAFVALPENLPEKMSFLTDGVTFVNYTRDEEIKTPDAALAVDCSSGSRMGIAGNYFDSCSDKLIIDHHASVELSGEGILVVPSASSASELCWYVCKELAVISQRRIGDIVSSDAAQSFLTGIVTDTGRFTFTNTKPETLEAAGELMRLGAQISVPAYWLFDRKSKEEFLISSQICAEAGFYENGKLAIAVAHTEDFERFNASRDSIGEVVSRLRDVDTVVVAFVLRELGNGSIRVNIRSKEPFDCMTYASRYNGGGHVRASGFTVDSMPIDELKLKIVSEVTEILRTL